MSPEPGPALPADAIRRPRLRWRALVIALLLLALAGILSWWSSTFIGTHFVTRPMPRDLLLDVLPYNRLAQYVADCTVALAMLVLLVHYMAKRRSEVPKAIAMFAVMYILRSAINVLTPLASPHGHDLYGWLPSQNGMFPSGHSANVLLCWLLIDREQAPGVRRAALVIALVEFAALLISRGHYTIDIVGGLLLGYFVWAEWTRGSLFNSLKRLVEA